MKTKIRNLFMPKMKISINEIDADRLINRWGRVISNTNVDIKDYKFIDIIYISDDYSIFNAYDGDPTDSIVFIGTLDNLNYPLDLS